MKITIAVTTKDEFEYIEPLFKFLKDFISVHINFNVVILNDYSKDNRIIDLLDEYSSVFDIHYYNLDNNFAQYKNYLNSKCTGDWILQLDADETISEHLLLSIPDIIEINKEIDAYFIPRINTVKNITEQYIKKWGWTITDLDIQKTHPTINLSTEELNFLRDNNLIISCTEIETIYKVPVICWPDYQMRLYKNNPDIKWINKVHEKLAGYSCISSFPMEKEYALFHNKTIDRQIKQNNYYDTLIGK